MIKITRVLKYILFSYFFFSGLLINILVAGVYFYDKSIIYKTAYKIQSKIKLNINPNALVEEKKYERQQLIREIKTRFGHWKPFKATVQVGKGEIMVGNISYSTLAQASQNLKDGQTMYIGEGFYREALIVKASDVLIVGQGRVVFDGVAAKGKAAIITQGEHIRIKNIECRNIVVRDKNGACIRSEGASLFVDHVYFHDSEQGIIAGKTELTQIKNSRFELLGKNGQAHGIYIGSGKLVIDGSLFIAAVSEGHEIKSRAYLTIIKNSIIASMSARDSRLIDISNGGELIIENSVLQQGRNSVNGDAIGYGLEKMRYNKNRIKIINSIIILERAGYNRLLHTGKGETDIKVTKNIIISPDEVDVVGFNSILEERSEAGYKAYPYIPAPSPDYNLNKDLF